GMTDEMRTLEAERVNKAEIVDHHVLHAGNMWRFGALAETGMEGQVDTEAVGKAPRPVVTLDCCRAMQGDHSRSIADRFDDRAHTVDLLSQRFEFHSLPSSSICSRRIGGNQH